MGRSFQGGNCTPDQNWACFVYYLKMFNTYLKNYMSTLKLYEKFANDIKISVGQIVALLIKTIFWIFWSITQELLGLLKLQCYFWVSQTILLQEITLFFRKGILILRWCTKQAQFWFGCSSPLKDIGRNLVSDKTRDINVSCWEKGHRVLNQSLSWWKEERVMTLNFQYKYLKGHWTIS